MIHLNNTNINITFILKEQLFSNNQNYEKGSSLFSQIIFSKRRKFLNKILWNNEEYY